MFQQGNPGAVINLLRDFLDTRSRAVLKFDVRIRNVQSSEPKSVTSNVTLFMPWKRRNQNTCSEHAFFAEILSPNIRIFRRIFFKLSSFFFCITECFYALIAIEHDFLMH